VPCDADEDVCLRLGARGAKEGCADDELRAAERRTWKVNAEVERGSEREA
jgi:hypothetical protein